MFHHSCILHSFESETTEVPETSKSFIIYLCVDTIPEFKTLHFDLNISGKPSKNVSCLVRTVVLTRVKTASKAPLDALG